MKKKLLKTSLLISVLLFLLLALIPPMQYFYFRRFVYVSTDAVNSTENTLLVLGAGIRENTTPSAALQDRLDTAYALYEQGKVSQIIVSGAKDSEFYNEPKVMKEELVKLGVSESVIQEDPEGFSTFDSCKRAVVVYNVRDVIVLSQGFHLPRALFLCRSMGLNASGVYSTGAFSTYYSRWYTIREVLAMYKAVWDVSVYSFSR